MADEKNNPQLPFGLNTDTEPTKQPQNSYRFALNAVHDDQEGSMGSLVNENGPCTDDLREIEYTFKVNVVQREDYTFKFWKGVDGDGENIFEEIIVPVVNQ